MDRATSGHRPVCQKVQAQGRTPGLPCQHFFWGEKAQAAPAGNTGLGVTFPLQEYPLWCCQCGQGEVRRPLHDFSFPVQGSPS